MPLKIYLLSAGLVAAGLVIFYVVLARRRWTLLLGLALISLAAAYILLPCFDLPGRTVCRGPVDQKWVALTFDDGPSVYTPQVLDILHRYGVPATFFVIGKNAERRPDDVERIVREGDLVGNHTFDHEPLLFMSREKFEDELNGWERVVLPHVPSPSLLFRTPHGWKNPFLESLLREKHYQRIGWTVGVWDTDRPGKDVILQRLIGRLKNGAIILLHDGSPPGDPGGDRSQTVAALPEFIEYARRAGYRFVDLPTLLHAPRP